MSARSEDVPSGASDYYLVLKYLATLKCPACGGIGNRVITRPDKSCKFCGGTGFKGGDTHLLVSSAQVRGGRRR